MNTRQFTRREFLEATGAGLATTAMAQNQETPTSRARGNSTPNILLIMSDEHNADVMGCAGNRISRSPNLDALAERGIVFENCYCNAPLCVPSRLSFTAGKYASRVGAWSNDCWLPSAEYPSLPRLLQTQGYESFLCGKMHYDVSRRYGFAEIGGPIETNSNIKRGKGTRRAADDLTPMPGISRRFEDFHTGDDSRVLQHDRHVTEHAVKFIEERSSSDQPFFLLVGYLAPHFPLIVPEPYWKPYQGKVPLPVIPDGFLDTLPRNYRHLRIAFNVEDVPEDIVRLGRELYYGFVQWLDEEIGKIIQALRRSDAADNTVVIYTSDHGENMGEHGLWWKNCMYDSAARIPLIVSWPERWKGGQRRSEVCSLVDVVQTLADLGGANGPEDWDGDPMTRWLDDPKTKWKDSAVSEYYGHNIASGYAMFRRGRFKYVYHTPPDEHHPAERELYDLEKDPGEFRNLAEDPKQAGRIADMHAALVREIGEEPDSAEQRCREDYARGYVRDDIESIESKTPA